MERDTPFPRPRQGQPRVLCRATWTPRESEELYNMDDWAEGYFSVAESGELVVKL